MAINIKELKVGSKVTYKGKRFFVTEVGARRVRAREIMNIGKDNPFGTLTHSQFSIPIKELK